MPMKIQGVGHVVLKVRDLERSARFYRDVLGLTEVGRFKDKMVFFSAGHTHHDLAILAVGPTAPPPDPGGVGLYHVAFKIGDSLDVLRDAKTHVEAHGVRILGMSDHQVSQSLYIQDPDGIVIELFVDSDPAVWAQDPSTVATVRPLQL